MGTESKIQWTDATWNPWMGCHKVSAACQNCYMFREQRQYGHDPEVIRRAKSFDKPLAWSKGFLKGNRTGLPHGSKIFVCSWSDFFIEEADKWRKEAWDVIKDAFEYTYIILTKRPERIKECLPDDWGPGYPNVWLGVTAENQAMANLRIPILLSVPSVVHFVSQEPALGFVDYTNIIDVPNGMKIDSLGGVFYRHMGRDENGQAMFPDIPDGTTGDRIIKWVIVGGESGPGARPLHPDWAHSAQVQCRSDRVPFFFKQWGEWISKDMPWRQDSPKELGKNQRWLNYAGGHGFHGDSVYRMEKVGKKAAGNLLDGKTYEEYPG